MISQATATVFVSLLRISFFPWNRMPENALSEYMNANTPRPTSAPRTISSIVAYCKTKKDGCVSCPPRVKPLICVCVLSCLCCALLTLTYTPSPMVPYLNVNSSDPHTVLLWTTWFGSSKWLDWPRDLMVCKHSNWTITTDKNQISKAKFVFFHCRDPPNRWPTFRYWDQIYVIFCMESPRYSDFKPFNWKMNMTITYRWDSDVVNPYFALEARTNSHAAPSLLSPVDFETKTRSAVWPVSHCQTSSQRELYVKELSEHLDIDIYGMCGPLSCSLAKNSECMSHFGKTYRFYLSFENSLCEDYVSEKLSKALYYDLIPVVFGGTGSTYSYHAPNGSYIDAMGFDSPKALALYLTNLANNKTAYMSYFTWRKHYQFQKGPLFVNNFCHELDNNELATRFHRSASSFDIVTWWHQDTCLEGWRGTDVSPHT